MFNPFEVFIGLRYVRAKRRNHFISFITLTSVFGVAVGVMVMITVLSVMNGFRTEMTARTLGMVAHATVVDREGPMKDWKIIAREIEGHPDIVGVAPYLQEEGMLTYNKRVHGTMVRGVIPEEEVKVSDIADKMIMGDFKLLQPGKYGIVIGRELSRSLGVLTGDKITLVAPQANLTPVGILPRLKRFTVVGIFEIGLHDFDDSLAVINLKDAEKLYQTDGPGGLTLKTTDVMRAPEISREIMRQIPGHYGVIDWSQRNRNFFRALKTEKVVMFIILTMIVAVAAFNIISTLIMVVTDKRSDIAVLRTLGASPRSIMKIFVIQGVLIGVLGVLLGDILGIWLSASLPDIVKIIEKIFNVDLLPCDVYYVCQLPTDMHWMDVWSISCAAFLLCFTATVYPALRAARTHPAEALRYE
jgi:lipoprotein-releasing system permease protein